MKAVTIEEIKEGQKVFCLDFDGSRINGTIHKNKEYPHVSEWYTKYEDGEECAVLDINQVYVD